MVKLVKFTKDNELYPFAETNSSRNEDNLIVSIVPILQKHRLSSVLLRHINKIYICIGDLNEINKNKIQPEYKVLGFMFITQSINNSRFYILDYIESFFPKLNIASIMMKLFIQTNRNTVLYPRNLNGNIHFWSKYFTKNGFYDNEKKELDIYKLKRHICINYKDRYGCLTNYNDMKPRLKKKVDNIILNYEETPKKYENSELYSILITYDDLILDQYET